MNNNGERMIKIEIPGNPVAKGRHRTTKSGRSYTPEKTRNWENIARLIASEQMNGKSPMLGAISINLLIRFKIPDSWPKWKKAMAKDGYVVHTSRPDADNILKAAKDALNGIVYKDDGQVYQCHVMKKYSPKPGVIISVEEKNIVHSKTKRCEIEED